MRSDSALTALGLLASSGALALAHHHGNDEHHRYRHVHHARRRTLDPEKRQETDLPAIAQPMVGPPNVHPPGRSPTPFDKRQATDIPAINQPMVSPPVVHPAGQSHTPRDKRQDSTIPAIDQPMVGPPNVHPPAQGYTPPPFLVHKATGPALTTSDSVPSAIATTGETTTLTLQPTTFSSAVYDGILVAVASFADVPTATMPQSLPGCTPICKQLND